MLSQQVATQNSALPSRAKTKAKKRILVVNQDQHEIKLLYALSLGHADFAHKYEVTVLSPYAGNRQYEALIGSIFPNARILGTEEAHFAISFLDKAKYGIAKFTFHASMCRRTASSKQKLLTFLGADAADVLADKKFPIRNLMGYFSSYVFRTEIRFLSEPSNRKQFDWIVFLRPDALLNIGVHKIFGSPDTKVASVCRNLDTPLLKGSYAARSDITLCMDDFSKEALKKNLRQDYIGKLIRIPDPTKAYYRGPSDQDTKNRNTRILLVACAERLITGQTESFKHLITDLLDIHSGKCDILIKLHNENKKKSFEALKDCFASSVSILDPQPTLREMSTGRTHDAHTAESLRLHYSLIQDADLVFSYGSTLNYEADLLGVRSAFLDYHPKLKFSTLYQREHLSYLIEKCNIPVLQNKRDLSAFIDRK